MASRSLNNVIGGEVLFIEINIIHYRKLIFPDSVKSDSLRFSESIFLMQAT